MGNKGRFAASSAASRDAKQPAAARPAGAAPSTTTASTTAETATATTAPSATTALGSFQPKQPPDEAKLMDAEDSYENARQNLTKITHGFWLQQYSWLHNDNALGCASSPATSDSPTPTERGGGRKKRESSSQPSPRKVKCASATATSATNTSAPAAGPPKRHRLLARWTNLMRNFGGSAGDQLASRAAAASGDSRLGSSSAPAAAAAVGSSSVELVRQAESWQQQQSRRWQESSAKKHKKASRSPSGVRAGGAASANCEDNKESKKRCSRFLKSLSSSTSTLLAPLSSHHHQQQQQQQRQLSHREEDQQQQQREDKGEESSRQDSPTKQSGQLELPDEGGSSRSSCELPSFTLASPKHSGPYRQIALAIARRSPVRRFQAQRAAKQSGGYSVPVPVPVPVSGAGAARDSQRPPVGEEAPTKRSRLTQFVLASQSTGGKLVARRQHEQQQQHQHQASGGLFSSIFGSPLFSRRSETICRQELPGVDERSKKQRSAIDQDKKSKTAKIRHLQVARVDDKEEAAADEEPGSELIGGQRNEQRQEQQVGVRRKSSNNRQQKRVESAAGMAKLAPTEPEVGRAERPSEATTISAGALNWLEEGAEQSRENGDEYEEEEEEEEQSRSARAVQAQSSSFEFKFQLEKREYYANEPAATATSTLACAEPLGAQIVGANSEEQEVELERNESARRAPSKRVRVVQLAESAQLVGAGGQEAEGAAASKLEWQADEMQQRREEARRETQLEATVDTVEQCFSDGKAAVKGGGGAFAAAGRRSLESSPTERATMSRQSDEERSRSPLILPLASSSSSLASSSILFDSASQPALAEWEETLNVVAGTTRISIAVEEDGPSAGSSSGRRSRSEQVEPVCERPASQPADSISSQPAQTLPGSPGGGGGGGQTGPAKLNRSSSKQASTGSSSARQKVAQAPSSGVGMLRSNFKKLVKRQQSVDSYRMARDQRTKLKRQQESCTKHQSSEAIKKGDEQPVVRAHRKFSMAATSAMMAQVTSTMPTIRTAHEQLQSAAQQLRICIDPYAKPGSFTLPGEEGPSAAAKGDAKRQQQQPKKAGQTPVAGSCNKRSGPTPPNTLSLMAANQPGQPGAFIVGSFSGCITPTYPTHHLPSPKYVSPAMQTAKKYSNASTISSLLGGDSSIGGNSGSFQSVSQRATGMDGAESGGLGGLSAGQQQTTTSTATNQSDTESSLGGSATHSRAQGGGNSPLNMMGQAGAANQMSTAELAAVQTRASLASALSGEQTAEAALQAAAALEEAAAAAAAERRANLAEHIYDNKCGLGEDMKFLASLPELCDITFLVGETREPVCAVKSVLAARSRVFHKILFGNRARRFVRQPNNQQEALDMQVQMQIQQQQQHPLLQFQHQQQLTFQQDTMDEPESESRRGSSPKPPPATSGHRKSLVSKSSSPMSRTTSPSQPQPWSVTSDASGYNPMSPSVAAEGGELAAATAGSTAAAAAFAASGGGLTGPVLSGGPSNGGRSGRVSVASGGSLAGVRESINQGSQQPLIIGPGQTAAPAPPAKRNKKSSIRDSSHHGGSRLSRMFMKRASDPSIKHNHPANANHSNQNYLDKMSCSQMSTTMIIEEFEPDVFRQLIEYIHTGCVLLQARTLLGLLNAADYYGLEQLRKACLRFVSCCITVDTVCSLLSTAERYIQYKCTKSIVQKVLEFVDSHADEIFKLNAFGLLPEHVVRLILARDGLKADEQVKYSGVYTWCEHYCRSYELTNISDVMRNFLDLIQFQKIPTNVLLTEIYPTHIVPDNIFLSALAYQANPENFEPEPSRARRMTLANPCTVYKDFDGASTANDEQFADSPGPQVAGPQSRSSSSASKTATSFAGLLGRKASQQQQQQHQGRQQQHQSGELFDSQPTLGQSGKSAVRGRKSTGSQPESKARKLRKGSIAQVSISGVMRKFSIKKRHSNASSGAQAEARRRASGTSSVASGRHSALGKQQSAADWGPMQLGQQILNAYLAEQRQREIERAERERLERKAAEEAKRRAEMGESSGTNSAGAAASGGQPGEGAPSEENGAAQAEEAPASQQQQEQQQQGKQPIVKSASTRKSFKDFRHISRRIFMRHSSGKMLQQTSSVSGFFGAGGSSAAGHSQQQSPQRQQSTDNKDKDKRRNVLKIRRSETVFETTAPHPPNSCLSPKLSSAAEYSSGRNY